MAGRIEHDLQPVSFGYAFADVRLEVGEGFLIVLSGHGANVEGYGAFVGHNVGCATALDHAHGTGGRREARASVSSNFLIEKRLHRLEHGRHADDCVAALAGIAAVGGPTAHAHVQAYGAFATAHHA